jgi:hypothetical protein
MRTLSLFLPALLLIAQLVYAEDVGPGLVEYGGYLPPEEVTSYIEARIENHGNYRVFVALPGGWSLNTSEYNVKSYAVREFGLWRIYDEEDDRSQSELFKEPWENPSDELFSIKFRLKY